MAPNFRTLRHGIDIGWDFGRNFYRGPNDKEFGLIRALRRLTEVYEHGVTDFAGITSRYFPPDYEINDWLNNERVYPAVGQPYRYLSPDGMVVVIDREAEASEPFPEEPPVEEDDPPVPDVYSTTPETDKWLYTVTPWAVVGKVTFATQAMPGYSVWSKVDNCWVVWTGSAWLPFLRGQERRMEVGMARYQPFIGGIFGVYVAVDNFMIPAGLPGGTGSAFTLGQVGMELRRNDVMFGSLTFPAGGRMQGHSEADVEFSPGDQLMIYTEQATRSMKEATITIKGVYS